VKKTTPEDGSGSTIAARDDLRVDLFFNVAETETRAAPSQIGIWCVVERPKTCRAKRRWTLPELWTHRTRPQLLGKPRTVSHERPPPSSVPGSEENYNAGIRPGPRPADDNYRVPLRSPAALHLLTFHRQK
jgi:hypothetical protein